MSLRLQTWRAHSMGVIKCSSLFDMLAHAHSTRICVSHELLIKRLMSQSYPFDELCQKFKSFWNKYHGYIGKYGVLIQTHLKRCFPCNQ
jgi:hypothetical protein